MKSQLLLSLAGVGSYAAKSFNIKLETKCICLWNTEFFGTGCCENSNVNVKKVDFIGKVPPKPYGPPPPNVPQACTNDAANWPNSPSNSNPTDCQPFQKSSYNTDYIYNYPDDFQYLNEIKIYKCEISNKRIFQSNGIPDHQVQVWNPNQMCVKSWHVEVPLLPTLTSEMKETSRLGINAIALNGVPIYGATEGEAGNAVKPDANIPDAKCWYGHAAMHGEWHYHSPNAGSADGHSSETLLGFALDGIPIYGPLSDDEAEKTDKCNGLINSEGVYVYHVKTPDQVKTGDDSYCPDVENPSYNQWNYVLGCYMGDINNTVVTTDAIIPNDCVEDNEMEILAADTDFLKFFH